VARVRPTPRDIGTSATQGKCGARTGLAGWGARIRTWEWRNQNPLPYHLATPQLGRWRRNIVAWAVESKGRLAEARPERAEKAEKGHRPGQQRQIDEEVRDRRQKRQV